MSSNKTDMNSKKRILSTIKVYTYILYDRVIVITALMFMSRYYKNRKLNALQ